MSIKLGKTKDSRIRKQPVKAVNVAEVEKLKQELSKQKDLTQYLLQKGYSLSTTKGYVKATEKFIDWTQQENLTIEQINYNDVLHYIQNKREQVTQGTISKTINSIKHYYNYLETKQIVEHNPTVQIQIKGIKRKTLYNILNQQELESLFNNFEIPEENNCRESSILIKKRNKIMLSLIIYQGLNGQELGQLNLENLKLREGKIEIQSTRKSNQRTLKLEAHQVLDMMEYTLQTRPRLLAINNATSERLLVSSQGGKSLSNAIFFLIKDLKKQSNKIQNLQQIRASVITHWLRTYNLREVQYKAGHKYVSSTESYLINDLEGLQEDITKFHPIG